jgi:phospholipid/cholesterol/gamma-HCH transport system substrate-binding protein
MAALAWMSVQVGGMAYTGRTGFTVVAVFDDVGDLSARSPVVIAGVKVGRVKTIGLDEDLRARVELDLDGSLELSIDSSAAIRTAGLLGSQFVQLEPGADDELLKAGEELIYTESALSIDKLVGRLVHGDALGDD